MALCVLLTLRFSPSVFSFRIIHYSFGAVLLYGLLTRFCRQLRLTVLVCVIRDYSGWAALDSCTSVPLPRTCLTCPSLVVSTWDLYSAPCCGSSATAAFEGWYAPCLHPRGNRLGFPDPSPVPWSSTLRSTVASPRALSVVNRRAVMRISTLHNF